MKPRIGAKLLKAVIGYANDGEEIVDEEIVDEERYNECFSELLVLLRSALAFYVESRRVELAQTKDKLARRDSMTDAQQAMAMACTFIEENISTFGNAAKDTPIYNMVRRRDIQKEIDRKNTEAAIERQQRIACEQQNRKIFTGFPATHRTPERK